MVLWLPFIPAGGPANYLKNLAEYQGDIFNILSLRAWNLWWLVQTFFAGGEFVADDVAFLGPLTLRHVGYVLTGCSRSSSRSRSCATRARARSILGLAAATLVAFCFLTSMHERYAYGALVFLMLLIPEARVRWLGIAFGIVFTLNLLAAVPPTPADRDTVADRRAAGDRRLGRDGRDLRRGRLALVARWSVAVAGARAPLTRARPRSPSVTRGPSPQPRHHRNEHEGKAPQ